MKKLTVIFCLILGCVVLSFAQKPKFKKVTKEELLKTNCEFDSLAAAEYLFHGCRVEFVYNSGKGRFDVVYYFHDRIKIYDEVNGLADHVISYYAGSDNSSNEKIRDLEAYTFYMENGKVQKKKLDKSSIFDEKTSKFYNQKKFAMPAVKKGCVMEIRYKLISPYYFNINEFYFQKSIPIKYTEFDIAVPEYFNYNYNIKGLAEIKVEKNVSSDRFNYTYIKKRQIIGMSERERVTQTVDFLVNERKYNANNVPSIKSEPYVYTMNNFRGALKMELLFTKFPNSNIKYYTKTWNDIAELLDNSDNFGKELNRNYKEFDDLIKSVEGQESNVKIETIYNEVKSRFAWNKYTNNSTNQGIKKMIKEGSGNTAEINLLLINLLRKAGIDANPLVSRKSSSGFLNIISPSISDLNYVTALVNDGTKNIYLDATDKNLIVNMLPGRALNLKGVIINGKTGTELPIANPNKGSESRVFTLSISNDALEGTYKQINKKYYAYTTRKNNNTEEDFIKSLDNEEIKYTNVEVKNYKDLSKDIRVNANVTINGSIQNIDDKIFIDMSIAQNNFTNPFKSNERNFAMFFRTKSSSTDIISIDIPEGYQVESLPEKLIIATPDMMIKHLIKAEVNGDKIIITIRGSLNQDIIPPVYYEAVKVIYQQVEAKLKEKIVLAKI